MARLQVVRDISPSKKPAKRKPKLKLCFNPKFKKPDAVVLHITTNQVAATYLQCTQAINPFLKPWIWDNYADIKHQDKRLYTRLRAIAEFILRLRADPGEYIAAQFAEWNGPKGTYPYLSTITSEGAIQRYNHWLLKYRLTPGNTTDIKLLLETGQDAFANDRRKLKMLMRSKDCCEKDVLISEYFEFSEQFLQSKGVWDQVAALHRG